MLILFVAREGKLTAILSLCFFLYMEFLTLGLSLGSLITLIVFIKYHVDSTNKTKKGLENLASAVLQVERRIDKIFTIDVPSENEATKSVANDIEISEDNPIGLPKDVKFQIEGGDTQTPPGYKEN